MVATAATHRGRPGPVARAAAGAAEHEDPPDAEVVEDVGHIGGHVRDVPAGPGRGAAVARPGRADQADASLGGGTDEAIGGPAAARRAVVVDEGEAVGRPGQPHLQVPAVARGEDPHLALVLWCFPAVARPGPAHVGHLAEYRAPGRRRPRLRAGGRGRRRCGRLPTGNVRGSG